MLFTPLPFLRASNSSWPATSRLVRGSQPGLPSSVRRLSSIRPWTGRRCACHVIRSLSFVSPGANALPMTSLTRPDSPARATRSLVRCSLERMHQKYRSSLPRTRHHVTVHRHASLFPSPDHRCLVCVHAYKPRASRRFATINSDTTARRFANSYPPSFVRSRSFTLSILFSPTIKVCSVPSLAAISEGIFLLMRFFFTNCVVSRS